MPPEGYTLNPLILSRGVCELTYFYTSLALRAGLFAGYIGCDYLSESRKVPIAGSIAKALHYGACVGLDVKGANLTDQGSGTIYDGASDLPLAV